MQANQQAYKQYTAKSNGLCHNKSFCMNLTKNKIKCVGKVLDGGNEIKLMYMTKSTVQTARM